MAGRRARARSRCPRWRPADDGEGLVPLCSTRADIYRTVGRLAVAAVTAGTHGIRNFFIFSSPVVFRTSYRIDLSRVESQNICLQVPT